MLATLLVAVFALVETPPRVETDWFIMATMCGLSLAPWLTLLCRSAIAGMVFTIAIPGLLAVMTDIAAALLYGAENAAAIDRLRQLVFWPGMMVICLGAAIASWRLFQRLEVVGDVRAEIHVADALIRRTKTHASGVRRSPLWLLTLKELRLQQMCVVVAALFVPSALALAWLDPATTVSWANLPVSVFILYSGVLALVIGSVASAEERRLGMLDWQLLLPMRAVWQWLIKVAVAVSLLVALGVLLPWALVLLVGAQHDVNSIAATRMLAALSSLLAGSLFISTLCRSGMSALVLSLPVAMASWLWMIAVSSSTIWRYLHVVGVVHRGPRPSALMGLVLAFGLVTLLLTLGARNHRSADLPYRRVAVQAVLIATYLTASVFVAGWSGFRY